MTLRVARRMDGVERTLIRRIFDAAPPGAINLGLGQPDLATPPRAALGAIAGIACGRTAYTSTGGRPELRAAVAARYPWIGVSGDGVAITVGSQEAVFAAMLALVDPGDEVLVPDPGYPAYPVVARLLGAVPVAYALRPERAFRLDADDVASRLTVRSRLIVVCSPSNPTGAIDDPAEAARLAALLEEADVAFLSDEIYASFAYDRPVSSLSRHAPSGGLVVSGVSKDFSMTGFRIGWVVGPEAIVARVVAAHQYIVTCAPSVSQEAAFAVLGPAGDEDCRAAVEIFRRRRALAHAELSRVSGLEVALPDGAFYFFLDVRPFGGSLSVAERLLARGVITIPGEAFGPGGRGFLRVSYAAPDEELLAGLGIVVEELSRRR